MPILEDGSKVIYVIQRNNIKAEEEIKLFVKDIATTLKKIRSVAKYIRTEYIRDIIYGKKEEKKKIRLRIEDNFEYTNINAIYKYKVSIEEGIKKEIEETIYRGNCIEDSKRIIELQGDFSEENSYEKTRVLFMDEYDTEITLDIYPFGTWLEIEGEPNRIHHLAEKMGYSTKDYINNNADELYIEWIKNNNLPEMWDVRFGLNGKK